MNSNNENSNIELNHSYEKKFLQLFVNREGNSDDSKMKTKDILQIFNPYQIVKQENFLLKKISNNENDVQNKYVLCPNYKLVKKPKQVKIKGIFNESIQDKNIISNNILGTNYFFYINENNLETIKIPVEETREEFLSYYNVHLIENNQIFNINNCLDIGLFSMEIGKNYVKDYLLKDGLGDGFYIETHNLPHYYYTNDIESSGYIIFGSKETDGFSLTAFKIKPNIGLYVSPYVFHTDSFLIGKYNVIYGKTNEYKTYLFRKKNIDGSSSIVNICCEE